ncbi:MAG: hypothetical protein LBM23_06465 [Propionibacteriaceae bacterium]|nr:hypothetical protein [Propionibacteriaceae bacterium]
MSIIAVTVASGNVGGGLGRAATMAVAEVVGGEIRSWDEYEVRWDLSHPQAGSGLLQIGEKPTDGGGDHRAPGHGGHHARIISFLREHHVDAVVAGHMGPPMAHSLERLGLTVVTGATGDARTAVLAVAGLLDEN